MSIEYVKLSSAEKVYSEKSLLESQASIISILQNITNYHKQRNDELKLKVELRSKIEETQSSLDNLDKALPKSRMKIPEEENLQEKEIKIIELPKSLPQPLSQAKTEHQPETKEEKLQKELEDIRKRLASLE